MSWRILKRILVLGLAFPISAGAAEYYPKNVSLRTFGIDQGNVGDCMAASEIGALENAFANRGFSFVKLSHHHRHASIWSKFPLEKQESTKLKFNPADLAFLQKAGPLLPDFMWPESSEGYSPAETGVRPHPSEAAIWDPEFPNATAMGFSESFFSFTPGYSNTSSLEGLKTQLAAGNAVTLAIHGDLLQPGSEKLVWDHVTGLLKTPYSWATLLERLNQGNKTPQSGLSHSVAVVGFDDSLYADKGYSLPGALIVLNSWNNGETVEKAFRKPTPQQLEDLPKMRLKLFSENLPGFYAIPYQYIADLMALKISGFKVFGLDYAAFAKKYQEFSGRYETVRVPYVCDDQLTPNLRLSDGAKRELRKFAQAVEMMSDGAKSIEERKRASKIAYQLALGEVVNRSYPSRQPIFQYATLARNLKTGMDRTIDFYSGRFAEYYCPYSSIASSAIWPTLDHLTSPHYRAAIATLSENGSNPTSWFAVLRALSEIEK